MTNLDSILKSRDITLPTKVHPAKAMVFQVVMYGCESWTTKKADCRRIDSLELWCWRRLESPLECKEIQPVHPKGNQSWIFIGRSDAEAETPILWPPDKKNWLIWKDPDAGKDWRREKIGTTEDEMVGWHHQLNGHEFELNSLMDREAWYAAVHGVTRSRTQLSDWTELTSEPIRTYQRRRMGTKEWPSWDIGMYMFSNTRQCQTGGFSRGSVLKNLLQCRSHGYDPWVRKIPWRMQWQPTPVNLPEKSHGQRSLAGYCPWRHRVGHDWAT